MNKNVKRFKVALRKAGKSGQSEYTESLPTHGYHSNDTFAVRRVPTAKRGKDGIVSSNPRRNTCMKVLHNEGEGNRSLTVHEPLNKNDFVIHKNHNYMAKDEKENNNYVQPKNVR